MLKQRAEDGKWYRFGHLQHQVKGFGVVIMIFDGTKFVSLNSREGIAVANEMVDRIHKKLEDLEERTIGLMRLK